MGFCSCACRFQGLNAGSVLRAMCLCVSCGVFLTSPAAAGCISVVVVVIVVICGSRSDCFVLVH